MLWIVQEDVHAGNDRYDLIHALTRLGIPFVTVSVDAGRIEPEVAIEPGQPVITNGSIMLSNIARERGWGPGGFLNDNFTYNVWAERYADLILNKNAVVCALKDAKVNSPRIFARPVLDNKTFNGRVFEREEFLAFQRQSLEGKRGFARPETEILLSAPKNIGQEHRHYIVDGEVVTSSRYKFAGQPNFREGADEAVVAVVREAIGRWTPARAFVMDTYIAGDEIGIVEIGGICHAGVYEADLMKLAAALDAMPFDAGLSLPPRESDSGAKASFKPFG